MLGGPGLKKDWNLQAGPGRIFLARVHLYLVFLLIYINNNND